MVRADVPELYHETCSTYQAHLEAVETGIASPFLLSAGQDIDLLVPHYSHHSSLLRRH